MTLGERLALRYGAEFRDAVSASPEAPALARVYFPEAADPVACLLGLSAGPARALRAMAAFARRERDRLEVRLFDDGFRALSWAFLKNRPQSLTTWPPHTRAPAAEESEGTSCCPPHRVHVGLLKLAHQIE